MTASSSQRNIAKDTGNCQICGQVGHGLHFGVISCRACAAFFRRTVVLDKKYPCQKADGSCEISKKERYICRKCRFNKCIRLGMTSENFQLNRDAVQFRKRKRINRNSNSDEFDNITPYSSSSSESSTEYPTNTSSNSSSSSTSPSHIPELINGIKMVTSTKPLNKDISFVYDDASIVFKTFNPRTMVPHIQGDNLLLRMEAALQRYRMYQKKDLVLQQVIDFEFLGKVWKNNHRKMAEWLLFIDDFIPIPYEEKMLFLRKMGKTFMRLERHQMSIQLFGIQPFTEKVVAMTDTIGVNFHDVVLDTRAASDYDPSYVKSLLHPQSIELFEDVAIPMHKLRLTSVEVTYMLCQVFFHVEDFAVSENIRTLAINVRNRISDEIHDYYTNVLNQPNYASRLVDIMTLCHTFETIHQKRSKMVELARLFDVIRYDICDDDDDSTNESNGSYVIADL